MKNDNLIKFFSLVNNDKALKAKFETLLKGCSEPNSLYEDVLRVCEGIISLAKTYDLHFTADELFDFLEAQVNTLSDDELMSVAGGVNRQAVGAVLSLLTGVSLMTGAISFIARNDNNKVANERDEVKLEKRISDDGDANTDAYKSAEKNKEFKGGQNNWKELLKDSKKSENKNGGASLKIGNANSFVNAKKSAKNELPAVGLKPQDKIKLDLKRVNKGQVGDAEAQKENLKTGSTGVGSSAGSVARAAAKQEEVKNTPSPSTKRVEQNVRFGVDNAKQETIKNNKPKKDGLQKRFIEDSREGISNLIEELKKQESKMTENQKEEFKKLQEESKSKSLELDGLSSQLKRLHQLDEELNPNKKGEREKKAEEERQQLIKDIKEGIKNAKEENEKAKKDGDKKYCLTGEQEKKLLELEKKKLDDLSQKELEKIQVEVAGLAPDYLRKVDPEKEEKELDAKEKNYDTSTPVKRKNIYVKDKVEVNNEKLDKQEKAKIERKLSEIKGAIRETKELLVKMEKANKGDEKAKSSLEEAEKRLERLAKNNSDYNDMVKEADEIIELEGSAYDLLNEKIPELTPQMAVSVAQAVNKVQAELDKAKKQIEEIKKSGKVDVTKEEKELQEAEKELNGLIESGGFDGKPYNVIQGANKLKKKVDGIIASLNKKLDPKAEDTPVVSQEKAKNKERKKRQVGSMIIYDESSGESAGGQVVSPKISQNSDNESEDDDFDGGPKANNQETQEGYFGLANPKSYTCFANAAIQQLYRNSVVRNAVLKAEPADDKSCTKALQDLFKGMQKGGIDGDTIMKFFEVFPGIVKKERIQEDSSEQYQEMIKKLEEEGLKFNEMKFETSSQIVSKNDPNVKTEWTKTVADGIDINIASDKAVASLDKMFDKDGVYDRQYLPGWNNDGKVAAQDATKSTKISSFPKVLVFNINRTDGYKSVGTKVIATKTKKKFDIPEELTIAGNKYKLKTVTVQAGADGGSGHYYAYSRGSDDKWRELNDSRVTEINYKDVQGNVATNATMATYEKVQ